MKSAASPPRSLGNHKSIGEPLQKRALLLNQAPGLNAGTCESGTGIASPRDLLRSPPNPLMLRILGFSHFWRYRAVESRPPRRSLEHQSDPVPSWPLSVTAVTVTEVAAAACAAVSDMVPPDTGMDWPLIVHRYVLM
jgi:hypothetical protein